MPNRLPLPNHSQTISLELKKGRYFPSIFRFIPETSFPGIRLFSLPVLILVCLISAALLYFAVDQYLQLNQNRQHLQTLAVRQAGLEKELAYWQKTADQYPNYPDVYLKIASLQYQLNNPSEAKIFIAKALSLNPNLQQGRVLGAKILRGE